MRVPSKKKYQFAVTSPADFRLNPNTPLSTVIMLGFHSLRQKGKNVLILTVTSEKFPD